MEDFKPKVLEEPITCSILTSVPIALKHVKLFMLIHLVNDLVQQQEVHICSLESRSRADRFDQIPQELGSSEGLGKSLQLCSILLGGQR